MWPRPNTNNEKRDSAKKEQPTLLIPKIAQIFFFANTKNKISVPEEPLKSVFQGHVVSHSVGVIPPAPFQKLQPVCSGCRQERVRSLQTS